MTPQYKTCNRHGSHVSRQSRLITSSLAPPSSMSHFNAAQQARSATAPVNGGINGCAYMGVPWGLDGVVCQNNMPRYRNSDSNFTGYWTSNINDAFPAATLETPGGMAQLSMGGGPGDASTNGCLSKCSCENSVDCQCAKSDEKCGWTAINQDCLSPVPNGPYSSLTACEKANSYGWVGK